MTSPGKKKVEISVSRPDKSSAPAGLVDSSPVGVVLLSADLRITYANPAAAAFAAATGVEFMSLVHPDDREPLRFLIARHRLSPRVAPNAELRFLKADGQERWVLVHIAPAATAGHGADITLWVTDIDLHKRAELERRKWEERWNSALVSSTLGVWDHDFKNGTMYYSDTWKQLRGMNPEDDVEASTEDWIETVHPDDRAHVLEWIRKQNEGEISSSFFEYRERRKDGKWVWIECRGSCVEWDANGKPTRIVGTDLDITDRKATEEMLAHVQRRLELALNVTQIGVFEVDAATQLAHWDDRILALFGLAGQPNLQPATAWQECKGGFEGGEI